MQNRGRDAKISQLLVNLWAQVTQCFCFVLFLEKALSKYLLYSQTKMKWSVVEDYLGFGSQGGGL
jgi:hypothetical protein